MAVTRCEIRPGRYYDSVVLMQLQRALADLEGVEDAGVVMATPANRSLLTEADLFPETAAEAGPDDLLIVVRGTGADQAEAALEQVDALLARRPTAQTGTYRPRSLAAAVKMNPAAAWVLISVPGQYAAEVAREALDLERHVFLFSDHVPLEEEADLKAVALERGLLVMGPDCGTAHVHGVGFGFANRVRRGAVGVVSASGTGLQAFSVEVHARGGGLSHAIGTGGRDLHADLGGITTRQGLDLLARDPDTRVVALISKPPAPEVAARVLAAARRVPKPVIVHFLGYPTPAAQLAVRGEADRPAAGLFFSRSLGEAADLALSLARAEAASPPAAEPDRTEPAGYLRGLFSGGTLAFEALLGLRASLAPLYSNLSLPGVIDLEDPSRSVGHSVVDLGADEFTAGRLHPMIDNDLRLRRLRQEAADPEAGLILIDVVLGQGAHPDPAAELAPAIQEATAREGLHVVALLVGTDQDPQGLDEQHERLAAAGARVFRGTAAALEAVGELLAEPAGPLPRPVSLSAFQDVPAAVNVGLESFFESVLDQGAQAVQVDWRPPAGGDDRLAGILRKMKGAG